MVVTNVCSHSASIDLVLENNWSCLLRRSWAAIGQIMKRWTMEFRSDLYHALCAFQVSDLVHTPEMTFLAAEVSFQEGEHEFLGKCGSNHVAAEAKYIHIVVLDTLMG
jgi:hypothetical protein